MEKISVSYVKWLIINDSISNLTFGMACHNNLQPYIVNIGMTGSYRPLNIEWGSSPDIGHNEAGLGLFRVILKAVL